MSDVLQLLSSLHTQQGIETLVQNGGIAVLVAIIFAETGLLAGFFLPGDSLLVTAGVLCSAKLTGEQPILSLSVVLFLLSLAAILGDQLGYYLGYKTGPKIFNRPDNRIFKQKYVRQAHDFYEKHGVKAIIIARFMPIFRTFVPFITGVAQMNYRRFLLFDILGGAIWIHSLVLLGYFIGLTPLGKKLHTVILIVIFLSILPMIIGVTKHLILKKKTV